MYLKALCLGCYFTSCIQLTCQRLIPLGPQLLPMTPPQHQMNIIPENHKHSKITSERQKNESKMEYKSKLSEFCDSFVYIVCHYHPYHYFCSISLSIYLFLELLSNRQCTPLLSFAFQILFFF